MLKYLSVFLIVVLSVSCDSPEVQKETYWDSVSYFQSEITRLTHSHAGLDKKLVFDTHDQSTNTSSPDWKKELEPFLSIDLQKVNYKGRFEVDTNIGYAGYIVRYQALDNQTDLQSCRITYTKNRIVNVNAEFVEQNSLYRSTKKFHYDPVTGYSISGEQQVTLSKPVTYNIEGKFVSP